VAGQCGREEDVPVARIAVIGARVMGRGIGHAGALGSFEVRLHDIEEGAQEIWPQHLRV
jgi:3-hydroxyacyl-CoA dehydrogenase